MTEGSKMPDPGKLDQLLDDLATERVPEPSDALLSRVMADAEAYLPSFNNASVAPPWWQRIIGGIGGWGAVGGLVAATVTGFVIGLGALDGIGADAVWSLGYGAYYDADLGLDAFGWALEEG